MRRPWKIRSLTPDQLCRREELPVIMDGCNIGGCIPMDDLSEEIREELDSEAVEFDLLGFGEDQKFVEMPVLKYNEAFKDFREERISLIRDVEANGQCLLPWEILKSLPVDRKRSNALYFSQGNLGSCMSCADAFALHSSILIEIGLGKPFVYSPYNNVVTFGIIKGNLRGGLDVASMAEGSNRLGHYPIELVGDDNQRMPSNYKQFTEDAKQFQAAVMFLDFKGERLADEIIQCCRAGLSVPFGNSTAVSGSTIDSNGVKVAVIRGSWAHATHFSAYRVVNGTEYVFWVNSHGPRYNPSDEGEPGDGCWMTRALVERMCSTMPLYGSPYVVLPESIWGKDRSLVNTIKVPFPNNWRR